MVMYVCHEDGISLGSNLEMRNENRKQKEEVSGGGIHECWFEHGRCTLSIQIN